MEGAGEVFPAPFLSAGNLVLQFTNTVAFECGSVPKVFDSRYETVFMNSSARRTEMSRKASILNDADFKSLSWRKNAISLVLAMLELALYFGFVALVAFNKPFLSSKLFGAITIGIPVAVGTILLSWLLTGVYILWANKKYDVLVKKVREKVRGQ